MKQSDTSKILKMLGTEYRGEVIDPERTALWHAVLGKLEYRDVHSAVVKWLSDPELAKWFPKPGQLKSMCEDRRAVKLEEDPDIVERYFALTRQLQNDRLGEIEERELDRIEATLGISKLARAHVNFDSRRPAMRIAS